MKRLLLASTSVWRASLLMDAGIPCEAVAPMVDEARICAATPEGTAVARARAKAIEVWRRQPEALVIGADQVAHLEGNPFGKPRDHSDWLNRLKMLRGRGHALTTGVALVEDGREEVFTVTSRVYFRSDLTDEDLAAYVELGEAEGCAGGYMVERRGAWLIATVEGDWGNVIGLPVLALVGRLRARGWRLGPGGLAAPPATSD